MKPSNCPAKGKKKRGKKDERLMSRLLCHELHKLRTAFGKFPVTSTSFTTRLPAKLLGRMGLRNVLYMTFSYFMYIIFSCKCAKI